jgi:hypothetical protein
VAAFLESDRLEAGLAPVACRPLAEQGLGPSVHCHPPQTRRGPHGHAQGKLDALGRRPQRGEDPDTRTLRSRWSSGTQASTGPALPIIVVRRGRESPVPSPPSALDSDRRLRTGLRGTHRGGCLVPERQTAENSALTRPPHCRAL